MSKVVSFRNNNTFSQSEREPAKSTIVITPTFLLRGVDPSKVLADYLQGRFSTLTIPKIKIQTPSNVLTLAPQRSSSPEDEIYIYRDKTNVQQTVVTTNHSQYKEAKERPHGEIPAGGRCNWCLRLHDNHPVGIPIEMSWIRESNSAIFYVDQPHYCRFECALAGLKRDNPSFYAYRDPLYIDAEQMLHLMYRTIYPEGKPLRPAPDWRLYKGNGGPLSDEDYFGDTHIYTRTVNVILCPVKIEYLVNRS